MKNKKSLLTILNSLKLLAKSFREFVPKKKFLKNLKFSKSFS